MQQQPLSTAPGHLSETRPPNHRARAIVLLLLLVPLSLLIGGSSAYEAWSALTGPPFRSEVPSWLRALMDALKAFVALIAFFMPLAALAQSLKVDKEFDAGNYNGAATASKAAANYCKQSLIFLVLIITIMVTDLMRYAASRR
jgi:hypothetical protein